MKALTRAGLALGATGLAGLGYASLIERNAFVL